MAEDHQTMDISNNPDLLRLVEEVRRSNSPLVLRQDDQEIAVILPLANGKPRRGKRAKTQADYEAFLAAAGSWKDVDVEAFKAYIRERRDASSRPPVDL
jgi:hypothetical protein